MCLCAHTCKTEVHERGLMQCPSRRVRCQKKQKKSNDQRPPALDISEVTKSQRNRRRQRRLQIFQKNSTFKAVKIKIK